MTERKVIKGDSTFEVFRRKLEDRVTLAINSGRKISSKAIWWKEENCGCPLGCMFDLEASKGDCSMRAPSGEIVANIAGIQVSDAWNFIYGFGSGFDRQNPYSELGSIYKERFP